MTPRLIVPIKLSLSSLSRSLSLSLSLSLDSQGNAIDKLEEVCTVGHMRAFIQITRLILQSGHAQPATAEEEECIFPDLRSLVFDLSIAHERYGSSSHPLQDGHLAHPQDIDAPLHIAAQRKINSYRQQYVDNQNISFLPAILSTSTRMQGEFLRHLFLQAHRETEAHFTATEVLSQRKQSDAFRFKRAAFYQGRSGPSNAANALSETAVEWARSG